MTTVHIDIRQLSGVDPGVDASRASFGFWVYQPIHVEDGSDDYLLNRNILRVKTVDGVADVVLPETPAGNAMWVQGRGYKGADKWLVAIPADDRNLWDLPALDESTLDPATPPSPAWLAALEALTTVVSGKASTAALTTETNARVSGDQTNATAIADEATARTSGDSTNATAAATALSAANAAQSTADSAVIGLGTKVNTSTYTAGLALKADVTALTAEATTRSTDDQTIAQALNDYATANNSAMALKVTAPTSPADGQLIAWSTSLGAWTKVNPVGAGRIASNINNTNTVTTLSAAVGVGSGVGTQVVIPSTAISVTNSGGRPVVIHFGATFLQNVAGVGSVYLALTETTSGNVDKISHITPLTNSISPVIASQTLGAYEFDIGAVTTTRTFTLRALLYTSSAACGGNILNSPTNPSWIRAVAE